MYGLPQAGLIAQQLIGQILNKEGYYQSERTPGIWTHKWRPIAFSLCVEDFSVKYVGKTHSNYIMYVLQDHYKISSDWSGKRYLGLDLDWEYVQRKVHLSIIPYVLDALKCFQHKHPQRPQDQPHPHIKPTYGAKAKYIEDINTSPLLSKADKKISGNQWHFPLLR